MSVFIYVVHHRWPAVEMPYGTVADFTISEFKQFLFLGHYKIDPACKGATTAALSFK